MQQAASEVGRNWQSEAGAAAVVHAFLRTFRDFAVVSLAAFAAADLRCSSGSWLGVRLPEARCAFNFSAFELPSVRTMLAFITSLLSVHAEWCCRSGTNRLQQH